MTLEKETANSLDSVAVVAQLLDELAAAPAPMGVSEIARALNQSKARIHRNLVSLKHFGLIDQDEATEKYRLGWKLFQLGERAGVQSNIRAIAAPYLKLLCETTGQSSLLSIPLNGEALVIAAVDNESNVSITVKPGNRPLPHCSAQGRIALAYATDTQRERLLSGPLLAPTPHSLVDIHAIDLRLQRIREHLMEDAPNEALTGINVLAAPILRSAKDLIGIVAIVGSIQNIPPSPAGTMADMVRGCAAALSKLFGCDAYEQHGIAIPPEVRRLMPSGR
ncbi:IclR family transcriptional regulator [Polaromonas sp. JS666]|uniref:IclR family transcriptional regulator n=1 Tax=Polaromonas sp. (strain JS666 / ATCC BAA-500) TaxID=296591 RepID=UPI0000464AEE|nr:IclR family transcriptional regulator [Polaromonas sp. JS666]ABE45756.1 transcriptional regulator, IclR family [Polaromonas sp. JS666]